MFQIIHDRCFLQYAFVDVEQLFKVLLNILWHVQNYKTVIDLFDTCYGWMKHIATVYYMFIPGIAQTKCSGFITVHGHYSLVSKFVKLVNFTVLKNVWIHGKLSNLDKYFCRSLCDSVMYIAVEATLIDTNERCTWLSFCVWCILD